MSKIIYLLTFLDGEQYTKITVLLQIDLQNALQNMLRGAYKSGTLFFLIICWTIHLRFFLMMRCEVTKSGPYVMMSFVVNNVLVYKF